MTSRAGQWATREVGAEVHTVTYAAAQLGVAWHTVMDAVAYWGQALIEDPDCIGVTEAVGVDETKRLAARRRRPTRWISAICDVARRIVIDVIKGRDGRRLEAWLAEQPQAWRDAVMATVTDLHESFRQALAKHLRHATAVADPFHVVATGNRVVDRTRRRVQQQTLGHRGRKHDPLYRIRKLLVLAAERLDEHGQAKLRGLLAAGDPHGDQEGQTDRHGVPVFPQLPAAHLARLRRLQLGPTRNPAPLKREAPANCGGGIGGDQTNRAMRGAFIAMIRDLRSVEEPEEAAAGNLRRTPFRWIGIPDPALQ